MPAPKRQRIEKTNASDDDEDEDVEFEDVHTHAAFQAAATPPSGDLELTLTKETRISLVNPLNKKQGPSKIERQIRISTHCIGMCNSYCGMIGSGMGGYAMRGSNRY